MALANREIAERLEAFAGLLELMGAAFSAARAYRHAAETIRELRAPADDLVRSGRIRELRGIGPGIAARLEELVLTGTIAELEELERVVRPELIGLGRYLGFAPERMVEIYSELDVRTASTFRELAFGGGLQRARGVGPVTERRVVDRLTQCQQPRPRRGLLLHRARALVGDIARSLGGAMAGDVRRWADTPHDLAVVVGSPQPVEVLERFERLAAIVGVVERSERRAVGVTVEGVPVSLVVATPETFGTELVRATGSREYVAALELLPPAADEEQVYRALGVPWCPPELRESPFRGEPPPLVELSDLRGDLHCHTTWSDGKATVREMAGAARELGYEYIAICDHTTNGVSILTPTTRSRYVSAISSSSRSAVQHADDTTVTSTSGRQPLIRRAIPRVPTRVTAGGIRTCAARPGRHESGLRGIRARQMTVTAPARALMAPSWCA